MTYLFLIFLGITIYIQYKREKNIVNLVSILFTPYFFIVFFNNLLFIKNGFYRISNPVLIMILSSLLVFFLGATFATPKFIPVINETDNKKRFEKYRIVSIRNILLLIGIFGLLRVAFLIGAGHFSASNFDDSEGLASGGIVGHLLLFSYSILPIDFLYWLENKSKLSFLLPVIMIIGVTFASFIKYNVIGVVITLFIFTCLYKKSYIKRGVVILVASVVLLFLGNYAIGFYIRSTKVNSLFYFNHFWNYVGGSLIYDNYLFPYGINTDLSIGYKLMIFIMAFPNMFIRKLYGGEGLFRHVSKDFLAIGSVYGQISNVTDAFGYLYPVGQGVFSHMMYYLMIFVFGFIFSRMYLKAKIKSAFFNTFICNFMTYFVFLSFFGTFYINPGPWEILLYSSFAPLLFFKDTHLSKGIIKIS